MDLNRLHFDHQLSLIRASATLTGYRRRIHETRARRFAALITHIRASLRNDTPRSAD